MKRFEFSLDRVLRWRAAQLSSEQAKLRRLLEDHSRIEKQIRDLRTERLQTQRSPATLGSLRGSDLATLDGYRKHTENEERRLLELLTRKGGEIAEQQNSYREAKRRCRLLEELRDRKLSAWRYEQDKEIEELAAESFNAALARERSLTESDA